MSLGWTSFSCSLPASDNMGVPILVPPRKGVGIGGGADGAEGCEIAFWPVICVPSSRPAEIWWEKLLFMAGMTFIFEGTPVMAPRRYMADSKLPVKSRAPVRKRFPTDADWKLKDEVGRRRFTISRLMVLKRERMSSRFSEEMDVHSACLASTTSSHSIRARGESGERRWLNSVLIAVVSGEEESSGISLTSRLLTSPIPGPPNTLINSLDEPPLSDIGMT